MTADATYGTFAATLFRTSRSTGVCANGAVSSRAFGRYVSHGDDMTCPRSDVEYQASVFDQALVVEALSARRHHRTPFRPTVGMQYTEKCGSSTSCPGFAAAGTWADRSNVGMPRIVTRDDPPVGQLPPGTVSFLVAD
jgi:hypothetical protein